jgi:hypothetical protein
MIITCAEPFTVGSAPLMAVIVTGLGLGTVLGAVYRPVAEMVPTVALPPGTALTAQVTALPAVPVPCTVAANCSVWPTPTRPVEGVTVTTGGGEETLITVTWAESLCVGSASLTAVIVTGLRLGNMMGAVYSPVDVMMPTVALPPDTVLTN